MLLSLIITCILFDLGYIYCKEKQYNMCGFLCKTLAALAFIIIGYTAYKDNQSSFCLTIILGLIFDGLGDIFLAIRNFKNNKKWFVLGGVFFMFGHLFYIGALVSYNIYSLPLESAFIAFGVFLGETFMKIINKKLDLSNAYYYLGIIYCPLIFVVMTLALCSYLSYANIPNLVFLIGSILFVSSDVILIINNFGIKKKWMHPTYSLLYFVAQILISYSLHL